MEQSIVRGGPAIMRELDQIRKTKGGCPTGSAVATSAGSLPAKWVFHAVGPIYSDGESGEPQALRSAYRACLDLAEEKGAQYISFPSISTGVYGYPIREAAAIALDEVANALRNRKVVTCSELSLFCSMTAPTRHTRKR